MPGSGLSAQSSASDPQTRVACSGPRTAKTSSRAHPSPAPRDPLRQHQCGTRHHSPIRDRVSPLRRKHGCLSPRRAHGQWQFFLIRVTHARPEKCRRARACLEPSRSRSARQIARMDGSNPCIRRGRKSQRRRQEWIACFWSFCRPASCPIDRCGHRTCSLFEKDDEHPEHAEESTHDSAFVFLKKLELEFLHPRKR